jgi:hypothetical protein
MRLEFRFNAVHLIESIPPGEGHPARLLHEDTLKWKEFRHEGFTSRFSEVASAADLERCLAGVHAEVNTKGVFPLLHLDMHGSERGVQLRNGDFMAWSELKPLLQRINVAMCNNLLVTMSTCNGWHLARTLSLVDRAPVFGVIGCKERFSFEAGRLAFTGFYEKLLTTESIADMLAALGQDSRFILTTCSDMFVHVMRKYIAQNDDTETLVARAMDALRQAQVDVAERPDLVCQAAAEVASLEKHFAKFKRLFFMTDLCERNAERFPITYRDVAALAAEATPPD